MGMRFNPAPGWPPLPAGFTPEPGWQPDSSWPPAPPEWQLWVDDGQPTAVPAAPPATSAMPYQAPPTANQVPGRGGQLPGFPMQPGSQANIPTYNKYRQGRGGFFGNRRFIGLGILLVVVIVGIVVQQVTSASRSSSGQVTKQGNLGVDSLRVGDCFDSPSGSTDIESVTAIPCTQAHDSQIYAEFSLADGDYPGSSALQSEGDKGCNSRQGSVNEAAVTNSVSANFFVPEEDNWDQGNRTVICIITNPTKTLTHSLLNS